MLPTTQGNLYDYPKYYDLVYGSDWKAEYEFLLACFEKHAHGNVERVFEPACGTGRLLVKLAQAGFDVAGVDLNAAAVDFCNDRLERSGFPRSAFVGDMCDFTVDQPVDAAFNTINSFRHLPSEAAAEGHLACVARAVRPGGVIILETPEGMKSVRVKVVQSVDGEVVVRPISGDLKAGDRAIISPVDLEQL